VSDKMCGPLCAQPHPHFRPPGPPMHPPQHHPLPVQPAPEQLTQTATIRNAVNLKKNSLRLEPVDGDSSRLAVHFDFDASEPCWCVYLLLAQLFLPCSIESWQLGKRACYLERHECWCSEYTLSLTSCCRQAVTRETC
jgi:hypothetical protein